MAYAAATNSNRKANKMSELEKQICNLRKQLYGLTACTNCPIDCPTSSHNTNQAENVKTVLEELETKYGRID